MGLVNVLIIIGLVFPAVVSCDSLIDSLESSYSEYKRALTGLQKESIDNFFDAVNSEGVVYKIDQPIVVPENAYEKSVVKVLVKKHGKYSPHKEDINGFSQFLRDYNTFVLGPCDTVHKNVLKAEVTFYLGVFFNHDYIDIVKGNPILNDYIEKTRMCLDLHMKSSALAVSSYEYMVNQKSVPRWFWYANSLNREGL